MLRAKINNEVLSLRGNFKTKYSGYNRHFWSLFLTFTVILVNKWKLSEKMWKIHTLVKEDRKKQPVSGRRVQTC